MTAPLCSGESSSRVTSLFYRPVRYFATNNISHESTLGILSTMGLSPPMFGSYCLTPDTRAT